MDMRMFSYFIYRCITHVRITHTLEFGGSNASIYIFSSHLYFSKCKEVLMEMCGTIPHMLKNYRNILGLHFYA